MDDLECDKTENRPTMAEAGNSAAMRDALKELMEFTCNSCERRLCEDDVEEEDGQRSYVPCSAILKARAALAAPPRNCDVGTAEEQTRRLRANCEKYKPSCKGCKFLTDIQHENCWLKWAQMPFAQPKGEVK